MAAMANQRGLTLVPLKLYIKKGIAKLELGVARGKRFHDKRESIAQRESDIEIARALKRKG
ncbi:MAG: SsrA-binding protein [Chloroflexi bacterium]|nr:SsrA-binding protein [Chloroflexota bacterium]